jgi:protein SCO1
MGRWCGTGDLALSWLGTGLASTLSLIGVLGAFGLATDGFTLLTAEEARRRSVARERPLLPLLTVQAAGDPQAATTDWSDALRQDGRVAVMHFIYTGCRTLCTVQSAQTRELQRQIRARGLTDRVRLVTVSFDPQRDSLEVLARHAARFEAQPGQWSMWRPSDAEQLQVALRRLGIIVLDDAKIEGEFVHNAAWLVIDRHARLRAVVPQESPLRALRLAWELAS